MAGPSAVSMGSSTFSFYNAPQEVDGNGRYESSNQEEDLEVVLSRETSPTPESAEEVGRVALRAIGCRREEIVGHPKRIPGEISFSDQEAVRLYLEEDFCELPGASSGLSCRVAVLSASELFAFVAAPAAFMRNFTGAEGDPNNSMPDGSSASSADPTAPAEEWIEEVGAEAPQDLIPDPRNSEPFAFVAATIAVAALAAVVVKAAGGAEVPSGTSELLAQAGDRMFGVMVTGLTR